MSGSQERLIAPLEPGTPPGDVPDALVRRPMPRRGAGIVTPTHVIGAFAVGAVFAALGIWQVHTVFTLRNHEMRTVVLQDRLRSKRDTTREIATKVGALQSQDSMRQAALSTYGMVDPEPQKVSKVTVPSDVSRKWAEAERQAMAEQQGFLDSIASPGKEVPAK